MAISRVNTTAFAELGTGAGPHTVSHAGGSCDCAIVYIMHNFDDGIDTVTYGGVAMTRLAKKLNANNHDGTIWGLNDCLPGTQDVVITLTSGGALSGANKTVGVTTYKGVSTTATFPDDADQGGSSPIDVVTVTLTTTVDNCILVGMGGYEGAAPGAVADGTDTFQFSEFSGSGYSLGMEESIPLNVGLAGAKSIQVNSGNNGDMILVAAALAPNPTMSAVSSPMIL